MSLRSDARSDDAAAATTTQIRGSTFLLVGRVAALAVTFVSQVLVVRYLTKDDYGAFAYALSAVAFVQPFLALGLDLADTRFFALYDERDDRPRLAGLIALEAGTVLGLGALLVGAVVGLRGALTGTLTSDPQSVHLLALLIGIAPAQAFDTLALDLFAIFAGARTVFLRRFVLAPGLRLVALVVVMGGHLGVTALAIGYLAAAVAGSAVFIPALGRLLRHIDVGGHLRRRRFVVPAREVFAFALPLLSASLVLTLSTTLGAIVLGHSRDTSAVAAFRAVQPVATLVTVVHTSFAVLFQPLAARLHARSDPEGLSTLYWRTVSWLTVLSFPVAALCICFAQPVTVTLFGERYASSATYLAILAAASYVQAASGFNGATLQIVGRLGYLMTSNVIVCVFAVVANILLVAWEGALGAAVATAATVVLHNALKQAGLSRAGVRALDLAFLLVLARIAAGFLLLAALQVAVDLPVAAAVAAVVVVSVAILRSCRGHLALAETFPELARLPGARWLIGS